jgi:hypothetical protein
MPYVHTVRCPNTHRFVEVCTAEEDGYAMGTLFEFDCPECKKRHGFRSMAVDIYEEGEPCPEGTVQGRAVRSVATV